MLRLDDRSSPLEPHEIHLSRSLRGRRGFTVVELMMGVSIAGVLATLGTYSVRNHVNSSKSVEAVAMLGEMRASAVGASMGLDQAGLEFGRVIAFGPPAGKGNGNGNNGNGNGNGNNGNGNGNSGNGNGNGGGPKGDVDGDGNHGHGNNPGGCDPSNPGNGHRCQEAGGGEDQGDDTGGGDVGGDVGGGDTSEEDGGGGEATGGGAGSAPREQVRLCGTAKPVPASIESVRGRRYQSPPAAWRTGDASSGWTCLKLSRSEPQHYQYGYDVGSSAAAGGEGTGGTGFTAWARGDLDGDGRTSWFTIEGSVVDGQLVTAPRVNVIDPHE